MGDYDSDDNLPKPAVKAKLIGSEEYVECAHAIISDPFDYESWLSMCVEVEAGRGGSAEVRDTYNKFLNNFPLSSNIYSSLASWYEKNGDLNEAHILLEKNVKLVRNVKLWIQYLNILSTILSNSSNNNSNSNGSSSSSSSSTKTKGTTSSGSGNVNNISIISVSKTIHDPIGRKTMTKAFENALNNVGYCHDSYPLWRLYLDYVNLWIADGSIGGMDPDVKMNLLRSIYQRALLVPMTTGTSTGTGNDNGGTTDVVSSALDAIWSSYQSYELSLGENTSKEILYFNETKYKSTKLLCSIKYKLHKKIDFNRYAIPSSKTSKEMEQLELWNKLIRYESTNPNNLKKSDLLLLVSSLYQQILCCFHRNMEVWLTYGKYMQLASSGAGAEANSVGNSIITEQEKEKEKENTIVTRDNDGNEITIKSVDLFSSTPSTSDTDSNTETDRDSSNSYNTTTNGIRKIYKDAMKYLPNSSLLRIALAEYEENISENPIIATSIYKETFDLLPSGLSFHVYLKHLRRYYGIITARKFFSSTYNMRNDFKMGYEIYLSNIQMELYCNNNPEIAIKLLELCKKSHPISCISIKYTTLLVESLRRCTPPNITYIRWIFSNILSHGGSKEYPLFVYSNEDSSATATSSGNGNSNGTDDDNDDNDDDTTSGGASSGTGKSNTGTTTSTSLSLNEQFQLWDLYLEVETSLCSCSVAKLNHLRVQRDSCLIILENKRLTQFNASASAAGISTSTSASVSASANTSTVPEIRVDVPGIFDVVYELKERHVNNNNTILVANATTSLSNGTSIATATSLTGPSLTDSDNASYERCCGRSDLGRNSKLGFGSLFMKGGGNNGNGNNNDNNINIPKCIKILIAKLPPPHNGELSGTAGAAGTAGTGTAENEPDIDNFIRHMKSVTLPPRPLEENLDSIGNSNSSSSQANAIVNAGMKRNAEWISGVTSINGKDGQSGTGTGIDGVDYDIQEDNAVANAPDDVFRSRQRAKRS